jgi:hypothetical protein
MGKAPRRKAGIELRRLDDCDSYSGRRRLVRACGTFGASGPRRLPRGPRATSVVRAPSVAPGQTQQSYGLANGIVDRAPCDSQVRGGEL